ncbi:hypothetical protein L873DRAFT_1799342 [Choiromyces venosus 120613-1]|uniref:Uncharacterized protein n=1 Tax=Choiromyces venosus 120613-1 TaxID=1336337 RepID=A0A3N4K5G6_9PEZI|nr:hypothetical protein L873DRAFT_1799342 [Choiromyces venosus 120613-1]
MWGVPACNWFYLKFVAAELFREISFAFSTFTLFTFSLLDWGYGHAMVGIVKLIR